VQINIIPGLLFYVNSHGLHYEFKDMIPIFDIFKTVGLLMSIKQVKYLIFDADDTLWENNIYYIRAAEKLVRLVQESGESKSKIESNFQTLEREVVQTMGYGSQNFIYILKTLFDRYGQKLNDHSHPEQLKKICNDFNDHIKYPPGIFPHVRETLVQLKEKYHLYVLTKGNIEEQWRKLEKSDLLPFFNEAYVKPEKNFETYKQLIKINNWTPAETCMIGNSPKSDINPALKAELWAVYIPYAHTWALDDEPLRLNHPRLKTVKSFPEIKSIFI
jgi:putative hydrolase of the HAD superfamily